ncbi:MAG: DEAD/DEAH box helicase family protein [Lawsonibacter sp.]|nr:DEAD/DEAH box helicase family protein [Lawsonibacter sp.]
MKYSLFDFQKAAANELLRKMQSMRRSYEADGSLSAVSLTAPTGSGKTVISAAVAEGLFFGNDMFPGDERAAILWLSDSPSLNEQTMKQFIKAADLLGRTMSMQTIGSQFSRNHKKLLPGHIYFLNRQLLTVKGKLSGGAEGGRSFYHVLADTIQDPNIHLFLFIDEAHRGLGTGNTTSEKANQTIYAKLIDGQEGINPPMPNVVGISATPERFDAAMKGRKNRDMKAPIHVPVSAVRSSGLIKDIIELRTPKKAADTRHQDLTQACVKLAQTSKYWAEYCTKHRIEPMVVPLMVVQVEDRVSVETLNGLCAQIHKILPWLDISHGFANVFGEHEDFTTPSGKIPYCPPEDIADRSEIRVLFAKDAVSTGWDCPRAEVIYSRRKRSDPTYIAQLIGRMIRTPLARRIDTVEELNAVTCYLPEYDVHTVELVVERLKEDNIAPATQIIKNPADVGWFGRTKHTIEQRLQRRQAAGAQEESSPPVSAEGIGGAESSAPWAGNLEHGFEVSLPDGLQSFDFDDGTETDEELSAALERIPKVDSHLIQESFEGIITRQVCHDKPNAFLDLWDCADIIISDIDRDSDLGSSLNIEFYNNIEGEICRHPAEFRRAYSEIKNTTVSVKRIDPLSGEAFEDREELVENDEDRMVAYYRRAVNMFAGASDLVKFYINKRKDDELDTDPAAIGRICAVAACIEIVQSMELWAERKTGSLLDRYGPQRYAILEDHRERWNQIEGNTRPYIERNLSIQAGIVRQNKEYDAYPKHVISDEMGWAYLKLNDLEKKIVRTELARPLNVAWYRNQSRNLNASLSIPYFINGEWENMYPDFIFFQLLESGKIVRTIVDPHGDWLGDSVAKLKGYVEYLRAHPEIFGSVQVVADERIGGCRYLDLTLPEVQNAIEAFTGSSAKELFTGPLSQVYVVNDGAAE